MLVGEFLLALRPRAGALAGVAADDSWRCS
jgi:hypothetical protein